MIHVHGGGDHPHGDDDVTTMAEPIPDEVRALLAAADVRHDADSHLYVVQFPPPGERRLLMRAHQALLEAGGSYSSTAGGYLFREDPRGILGIAEHGLAPEATPISTAHTLLANFGRPAGGRRLLEPSAGGGAIVGPAVRAGFAVTAIELHADHARECAAAGADVVVVRDFLQVDPGDLEHFPCIAMHPPFELGEDVAHVAHALRFLAPGGRLVAITNPQIDDAPPVGRILRSRAIAEWHVHESILFSDETGEARRVATLCADAAP